MIEIMIPSLYFLSGICFYVSSIYFFTGLQRPIDLTRLNFACANLSVIFVSGFHIQALQATSIDEYAFALKWTITSGFSTHICILWFVALYTKKVHAPLLIGFTLISVVLAAINLSQAYSLQYDSISSLRPMILPWGEHITLAIGQTSKWFLATIAVLAGYLIYLLYILGKQYVSSRKLTDLLMLLAWVFFIICRTQGILTRLSIIHFPSLGMYGLLGMSIAWSLILGFEKREQLRLAKLVYESSSEAIMVTDADNSIIAVNPAFTEITGYLPEEAIDQHLNILDPGQPAPPSHQAAREVLKATSKWRGEIWCRRKNGGTFIAWLSINIVNNANGSINRRIIAFSDISKQKNTDEMIWRQANFDDLTGLLNRRRVNESLEQEIKKSGRSNLPLVVMLIDLDRFKEVNDTLGHEIGDALLKEAGQRMKKCIRGTDVLGRLGGDEFIIILRELDRVMNARRIANDLLEQLAAPYHLGEDLAYISASIGITNYPEDAKDAVTLIKNADQAMYAAKRQGRNRSHYHTPAMQAAANMRSQLSNDLHSALHNKQFILHYQPIVELDSGNIHKAEALIRWQHPVLGLVSPGDFIPIAEDTGQIVKIGDWVFYQAATEVARLRQLYNTGLQISINKSPLQFRNTIDNHQPWLEFLKHLGLTGHNIVVEITESLLMDAKEEICSQLLSFRDHGIQVALDDFGTGYSSLSYLKKFDIDYLKIDQSFIQTLNSNPSDRVLCEAMVEMAHKLGIKVIAEGVETEQQRDLLKQIKCDYGQGYLFSKPVPIGEFEKLLTKGLSVISD